MAEPKATKVPTLNKRFLLPRLGVEGAALGIQGLPF